MSFIEDINDFFESIHNLTEDDIGSTFLTLWGSPLSNGTNLFFFSFPESPDASVMIFPRARPNVFSNIATYNPSFEFIVRARDKLKGYKTAELFTFVFDKRGGILSNNAISYIGSGTPSLYYLDEKGRLAFRNYVWFNSVIYNVKDLIT